MGPQLAGKYSAFGAIERGRVPEFVRALEPVPFVPADGRFSEFSGKLDLDGNLTMISPIKSHIIPDGGASFRFDVASKRVLKPARAEPKILFGVNPLDIRALDTLEKVFEKVPYFWARRDAITVIGSGDFSRCGKSFDIFLHDCGVYYLAIAGSKKGAAILRRNGKLFSKTGEPVPAPERTDPLLTDPQALREAVKKADKKVWEEVARTCLGCGICSFVCPLCYCFEVDDSVPVGGKTGARCTRWDSCMLESFSEVAGGHVFQNSLPKRIESWYYHKFARATAERGSPDCVGCDRCFHFCPVAINFREVLRNASASARKG